MYKPLILVVLVTLLCCKLAYGQETAPKPVFEQEQHELYIGYGLLSLPQALNYLGDGLGQLFFGGGDEKQIAGPVMLGYNHFLTNKISVGVEAGYSAYTSTYSNTGELGYRNNFYVLMPQGHFYWAGLKHVDFYSGLKAGVCYLDRTSPNIEHGGDRFVPAFHLTAIGLRVGNKLGFYIDSGTGFDGFMNAGANIRF
jgi:hypothetical protein